MSRPMGTFALALLLTTSAASNAIAQVPAAGFDGKDKTYELSAGSQLRAGTGLTDRLLYTVWERTTVKGTGACTDGACPISFNGKEVFARRSRLAIVTSGAAAPSPTVPPVARQSPGTATAAESRYPAGWKRLQRGDNGDKVKQLQELLIKEGATGLTADGNYGRGTAAAVSEFQKRKGLTADGIAGHGTLRALGL